MALLSHRSRRPRIADEVDGRVHVESGSESELGCPDRAALLVHWAPSSTLSRSFVTLASQLATCGYRLVVVSACEASGLLEWGGRRPDGVVVVRKPNIGYDFGSWSVGLDLFPALAKAPRLILANDSMVGPFVPLRPVIDRFEASEADVFGLTDSRQYFRHLQSYFLGFTSGVLAEPPLRRFFGDVRIETTKWDVVNRYELGFGRLLRRHGYGYTTAFRADAVVSAGDNPVIKGWWRLLERGFPFVKREIVRNPAIAPRGEWVGREILAQFGQRVEEWI